MRATYSHKARESFFHMIDIFVLAMFGVKFYNYMCVNEVNIYFLCPFVALHLTGTVKNQSRDDYSEPTLACHFLHCLHSSL